MRWFYASGGAAVAAALAGAALDQMWLVLVSLVLGFVMLAIYVKLHVEVEHE
jgi:hypothetical protein